MHASHKLRHEHYSHGYADNAYIFSPIFFKNEFRNEFQGIPKK